MLVKEVESKGSTIFDDQGMNESDCKADGSLISDEFSGKHHRCQCDPKLTGGCYTRDNLNCNSDDESESNYSVNVKESSHGNDEDYFEEEDDDEDDWETDSEYDSELCEREILEALKNDPDLLMRVIELGLAGDQADMNDIIEKLKSLPVDSPIDGVRQKGLADIDPLKVEQAKQSGSCGSKNPERTRMTLLAFIGS